MPNSQKPDFLTDYNNALEIAKAAHSGQKDKGGFDYILHPVTVSNFCETDDAKVAALLHDVVEDTEITIENLREMGVKSEILAAVDAISKREGEDRNDYLDRVAKDKIATEVKFCDMLHNSDYTRLSGVCPIDYAKTVCKRYVDRMGILMEKAEGVSILPQSVLDAVNERIRAYENI